MSGPRWVPRLLVESAHLDLLREHGGRPGLRDPHALEAALAWPRQARTQEPASDLARLAAAYGFALCRTRPFQDGNRRLALLTVIVFLGLNGYGLSVTQAETHHVVMTLSAGSLQEDALAAWIRDHMDPMGPGGNGADGGPGR